MSLMAKRRIIPKDDRHLPDYSRMTLRLRPDMAEQLGKLVELMGTDATHEIRNALRERLQKFDLWPPQHKG